MPATYTLISTAEVTTAGTTNALSFSSIPSTYDSLELIGTIEHTSSGAGKITINNDSASNYFSRIDDAVGGSIYRYANTGSAGGPFTYPSATNTQSSTAFIKLLFTNYKDTNNHKVALFYYGQPTNATTKCLELAGIRYASTSAISTITIADNNVSTYLGTKTKLSLYGIVNS